MRYIGTVLVTIVVILGGVGLGSSLGADPSPQAGIVAGELSTIANQLSLRPDIAIDLTKVSGEVGRPEPRRPAPRPGRPGPPAVYGRRGRPGAASWRAIRRSTDGWV